ncbi:MAG TPA: hypothetical protein VN397_05130, partial [Candidatus Methylomirabilis sp.]|nr:hypothetical protein [Candidatus Methylomirabilis sp.]
MPLTSSVGTTAGGKTVASFRPSRTRKPTTTPQAEVTQATALKHPLPTSERVDGLLIQTVLRNLDRGKSREEALAYTRNWLSAEVIGKSGDLTSVDREARLAQVKNLDVAAFWAAIDAKIAAKAKPQAPSPSDRPRPMADKPKTTPVRTTPASLASAALLAAFACANQMTAGDDEPEVTTGRDMEIPDEKPAPMIVTKPRTAAPTSNPRDNSGTPKPRVLMRLPLTTPGHVEDMVT